MFLIQDHIHELRHCLDPIYTICGVLGSGASCQLYVLLFIPRQAL